MVYKRKDDYAEQTGLTTKPIPTKEVMLVQVLHASLRSFDHFMKIAVHLRACVLDWSESPSSINKQFLVKAKSEIQAHIEELLGERWDFPEQTGKGGTTTTGNTALHLLHKGMDVVTQLIPPHYQNVMKQFGQQLSVILRVFNSSEMVNVQEYKKLYTNLYLLLLRRFSSSTKLTWNLDQHYTIGPQTSRSFLGGN